jgi:hypothetical protein
MLADAALRSLRKPGSSGACICASVLVLLRHHLCNGMPAARRVMTHGRLDVQATPYHGVACLSSSRAQTTLGRSSSGLAGRWQQGSCQRQPLQSSRHATSGREPGIITKTTESDLDMNTRGIERRSSRLYCDARLLLCLFVHAVVPVPTCRCFICFQPSNISALESMYTTQNVIFSMSMGNHKGPAKKLRNQNQASGYSSIPPCSLARS